MWILNTTKLRKYLITQLIVRYLYGKVSLKMILSNDIRNNCTAASRYNVEVSSTGTYLLSLSTRRIKKSDICLFRFDQPQPLVLICCYRQLSLLSEKESGKTDNDSYQNSLHTHDGSQELPVFDSRVV